MEDSEVWLKGAAVPEVHTLLTDLALGESPRWSAGRLWLAYWGADKQTLFMVAATWGGPASMADGQRSGLVLSMDAPAPHAGWPAVG